MGSPPFGGLVGTLPIPVGFGGQIASSGPSGPSHYWPMQEGSGAPTLLDHAGTAPLTVGTQPTWLTGYVGSSASPWWNSGASAQAASVVSDLNYSGSTPFTVNFWMSIVATANQTICGNTSNSQSDQGWNIGLNATPSVVFSITGATGLLSVTAGAGLNVTNPYMVTVTYDGSKSASGVNIYVGGVLQTPTVNSNTLTVGATTTQPFLVAARSDGTAGAYDFICFMKTYSYVISGTELAALVTYGPNV